MEKNNDAFILTMNIEEIERKLEKSGTFKKTICKNIIKKSLNNLPTCVWMNPDLKWLYISDGIGFFPLLVYEGLVEELPLLHNTEDGYSNVNNKKQWILKNMIYIVEINKKDAKLYKKILGKHMNLSIIDFMDSNNSWKKDFNGIEQFDIIMCNPPVNIIDRDSNRISVSNRISDKYINEKKNTELYLNYIEKSLTMTKKLLFIMPNHWNSNSEEIDQLKRDIICKKNINLYKLFFNL
jgi:hypothetical protein